MLISTTLHFNAVAPIDATTWRPYSWPVPGLKSVHNRGHWLSPHLTKNGADMTLADAWVNGNKAQKLIPVARLEDDPLKKFDPVFWGDYCKFLVRRYGTSIIYNCGNEIDTPGSWCFDGEAGGATAGWMWRTTVDAIHSVNGAAQVVCGSIQSIWPTGHGLQTLYNALKAYGPELPTDLDIHVYPQTSQTFIVGQMIEHVRGACRAHAKGFPRIWVTEWNYWPAQFTGLSDSAQGYMLRQMLEQFRNANVYASLHYLFDDHEGWGFKDRDAGKLVWNTAVGHFK